METYEAYEQLLDILAGGHVPVVLLDEETPEGAPVVSITIATREGIIRPHMQWLFHDSVHVRVCALIGLTIGAHRCWHEHQAQDNHPKG